MNVVICQGNLEQRHFIQSQIVTYATFHEPSIEIVLSAGRAEEVLSFIENNRADCYFLGMELDNDKLMGLKLAAEIRKTDPFAHIIFITQHADQLELTFTYKIAALDYIVKNNPTLLSMQIIDALKVAFERYKQIGQTEDEQFFQIKIGEKIKNILLDDIYYFETSHIIHKIKLHEKNGCHEYYGKLKDIDTLDERFFRCHKSYVVNIHHIKEINKKERTLLMTNGATCPVSHRSLRLIQKKLDEFSTNGKLA
ncbi:MAG: response regulator transcription factor [Lysinibacillus sp.]|nr:response regulator transcription factor [Lysinibacillus sp.]